MTEQPRYAYAVRDKDGDVIATYTEPGAAYAHADREPDATVSYDHEVVRLAREYWAAQNPDPEPQPEEWRP